METITFKNEEYVNSDYLFKHAPVYCKPVRSARELIRKKALKDYVYLKLVDGQWTESNGASLKLDKIFFKKSFVDTIPEIKNDSKITDDNDIELAPKLIKLKDEEKFKDADGKVIEIETRGVRTVDDIYFKVKDVASGFKLNQLEGAIIDKRHNGYEIEIHYKYFICKKYGGSTKKIIIKKELFFTYEGILRMLFVSISPQVKPFIKWATETIFALQMGTNEQKRNVISSALGTDAKTIKEVFDTSTNTLPCVYLFTLGTVKDLRESMKIDKKHKDDDIVAKYGHTKDLSRRTGEHMATYGKINNVDLKLKHYSYMDPQYTSQGENDIKMFMEALNIGLPYNDYAELVVIPKDLMKLVEKQYQMIAKNYMGHISELITKVKDLEDKLEKQKLEHALEIGEIKHKLEMNTSRHENEMLKKEAEILQMQLAQQKQSIKKTVIHTNDS